MSYSHSNRTPRNRNEAVASEGSSEEEEVGGSGRRRGHVEAAAEEAAPPTPSQAATSTLNDLMETLKLLEEEEKFPMPRNEKSAWSKWELGAGTNLTFPMLRVLLFKEQMVAKIFENHLNPVGIHRIDLTEYSEMSTHVPMFALFFIAKISHKQHKG